MRQWLSRILVALLLVPGLGVVALDYASAGACRSESFVVYDDFGGVVGYQSKLVDCTAGETPASDPPVVGTSGPPPCDVASATPATFCWGSYPCYYTDSVVPLAPPPPPQPTPGAKWHVRLCLMPDGIGPGQPASASWHGEAQWVGQAPQPPPMIDQAREAFGQLAVPKAKLVFNPTARTLVNLDTWFWAQGLSPHAVGVQMSPRGRTSES